MSGAIYAVGEDESAPLALDSSPAGDPLYRALLGGNIGSAVGVAKQDLNRNTLDEAISETLVGRLGWREFIMLEKGC